MQDTWTNILLWCWWWWLTGLRDPISCSLLGGVIPTQHNGYRITRLWTLFYLWCFFSCTEKMALVPPLPPTRFTRVPCPIRHIARAYSLSPPIASSPSVCCLFDCPTPVALVVTRRPPVKSLQPSDWLPADDMLPLVAYPASQWMKVCPARPVRMVVLGSGVSGGA